MKAAQLQQYGSADQFKIVDLPTPEVGPHDVLIKVHYAGLRWSDVQQRRGELLISRPETPFVPGHEASGVVEAVGTQVTDLKPGARVVALPLHGGFAEYLVVPRRSAFEVPDGAALDMVLVYLINLRVAYLNAYTFGQVKEGQTAMIHAAAGGVGLLTLQILKRRFKNVKVIALSSSDEKLEVCRQNGADFLINTTTSKYWEEAKRLTGGVGADVVFNGTSGPKVARDARAIKPLGRWVIYGAADGTGPIDIYSFIYNSITLAPFSIITLVGTAEWDRTTEFVADWMKTEKLLAPTVFPLLRIADAHRYLEERRSTGKVVIQVA